MSRKGENIYKRKDKRWEARYVKGCTPEGRLQYGYCYGHTYREVKDKLEEALTSSMISIPTVYPEEECEDFFSGYCEEWLQMNRSRVKESTYVKYISIVNCHILPRLGGYRVREFSTVLAEQFSYELLEKHLAPKTVRDILIVLHSILQYTGKHFPGKMKSLEIIYPKETKKEIRVLTKAEQTCLVEYLLQDMDTCKFGVLLALLTGLRIGEICALKWEDILVEEGIVRITSTMQRLKNLDQEGGARTRVVVSTPKSDTSVRLIPLTEFARSLCREWQLEDPEAYVLTGCADHYMEPRIVQYRLDRYTAACGLEGVHFHVLRHTFATRCVEVGFEIKSLSEILGHSNSRITLDRYVHSSLELKRDNMNKLSELGY